MMSQIKNHISFPNYTTNNIGKTAEVMAKDLEYGVNNTEYTSFHTYISKCIELSFLSNAHTARNAMD
jgi:hypothetical protein